MASPTLMICALLICPGDDTSDKQPPSVPQKLTASNISASQIDLSWEASTDNGGGNVAGYNVYQVALDNSTRLLTQTTDTRYTVTGLTSSTTYRFSVTAYDDADPANESAKSNQVSATTSPLNDTTAPSIPQNLNASAVSSTQINLSWDASTDTGGGIVAGYKVFRDGASVPIATVTTGTTYADSNLTANTSYVYTVLAFDSATPSNESGLSNSAAASTYPVSQNLLGNAGFEAGDTNGWNISGAKITTTTVHSGSYALAIIGKPTSYPNASQQIPVTAGNTYRFEGWISLTGRTLGRYIFQVRWLNASGTEVSGTRTTFGSTNSDTDYVKRSTELVAPATATQVRLLVQAGKADGIAYFDDLQIIDLTGGSDPVDTQPPSIPQNNTATTINPHQIDLNWDISTDNGGGNVAGYKVYRVFSDKSTELLAQTTNTTYSVKGLSAQTSYSFSISAFDDANPSNESEHSNTATAVTSPTDDTSPPSIPQNLSATATSATQVSLSWDTSTDTGGGVVVGYKIFRDGAASPIATVTSGTTYLDSKLTANTAYVYTVLAYDNASPANESALSSSASATTLPVSQNLLGNAGFEAGDTNGWNISGAKITTTTVHSGSYALAITGKPTSYPNASQQIPVTAGNTYRFEGWISLTGRTLGRYIFQVRWLNASGTEVSGTRTTFGSTNTDTDYVKRSTELVAPATASQVRLLVQAGKADGIAYFDDLRIVDLSGDDTPDKQPPSVPQNLTASNISASQIDLGWEASTDNGGGNIAGYNVYQVALDNSTQFLTQTTDPRYTVTGLTSSTTYRFSVTAYDDADPANESAKSSLISVTTLSSSAPSTPQNFSASVVSATQINLSWDASTTVNGNSVAGYKIFRNRNYLATVNTGTSYSDSNLITNVYYNYEVLAFDSAIPAKESQKAYDYALPTSTPQLLINGHFSRNTLGWNINGANFNTNNGTYDTGALEIKGNSIGYPNASQTVSVTAGESYRFEGSIKLTGRTQGRYIFQVRWLDTSGSQVGNVVTFGATNADTDYVKRAADLIAPATATQAMILLQAGQADGTAYFDDLNIRKRNGIGSPNLVKDVSPYERNTYVNNFFIFNNLLYFFDSQGIFGDPANIDIDKGNNLWKSDGTLLGTTLVKNIPIEDLKSRPGSFFEKEGELYFIGNGKLWKSDGTAAGTVSLYPSEFSFSGITSITQFNNEIYFTVDNDISGSELWKSDGTTSGTELLKSFNPGPNASNIGSFTQFNNELYFQAIDDVHGHALWKTNGTTNGTLMIKQLFLEGSSLYSEGFAELNSHLYFTTSRNLWRTDGSSAGTVMLDLTPGNFLSPSNITQFKNELYFQGSHPDTGIELWKTDGTAGGTYLVKDINPGEHDSTPRSLFATDNTLYFSAFDGQLGHELWHSDGTTDGTEILYNIHADELSVPYPYRGGHSHPGNFVENGPLIMFSVFDGFRDIGGRTLWSIKRY